MRLGLPVALLGALVLLPASARAQGYVALRGAYYREPSTRVIQPVVEVARESPSIGVDIGAHFLVDAITSASVASGTAVDTVFTEVRNEVGLNAAKHWSRTDLGLGYKYSAESDYWSHAIGGSLGRRFWGDTSRVALSFGVSFDEAGARGPARCPAKVSPCTLNAYYGGLAYSQVISPVALAQASYEFAYLDGFQGNLYRQVSGLGVEKLPTRRVRNALAARGAYYLPGLSMGFQLHARYYFDYWPGDAPSGNNPWGVQGGTIEGRLYKTLSPVLEVRLSYRQYFQSQAAFWCDTLARPDCYGAAPVFYSSDVKLGPVFTEYPEVKFLWEARAFADTPFLTWFAAGTFEISYGYFIQSTSYQNAHVLQLGFTMPY